MHAAGRAGGDLCAGRARRAPGPRGRRAGGHGERSRSQLLFELGKKKKKKQLLFKLGGTENMTIWAVNVLAVNFWLLTVPSPLYMYIVSTSVLYTLRSVEKGLIWGV